MQLLALIFKETCQLTPITYYLARNILGKIEASFPSQLVYQQKIPEQSNFLGNKYIFRGLKGTCKTVSQKNRKSISPSNNSLFQCGVHQVQSYSFWRAKLLILTYNISKLIFRRQKDFWYITKLMHFAQLYFLCLGFLIKLCKIIM